MRPSWALAAVAVVTLMASLGALIPIFADLAGQPLAGWKRGRRIVAAALLLIISSVTGFAAYRAALPRETPLTPDSRIHWADDPVETETIRPDTIEPQKPVPPVSSTVPSATAPPPAPRVPHAMIRDHVGRPVAQLTRVVQRVTAKGYSAEGELREDSEQSAGFEGMVTIFLTLDVTITRRGAIISAFTVSSRGGGYRHEDARIQAFERLVATLEERLSREVPAD
ncbi:MAG TPA: hypothetical protein VGF48_14555 [Thermoanaerobaculia bacterium]|jgi:hypothetical protein